MPASIGKFRFCGICKILYSFETLVGFEIYPVVIGHKTAGLDEGRYLQRGLAHQHARTQNEAVGNAVRLCRDDAAHFSIEAANFNFVTKLYIESAEEQGIDRHTISAVLQCRCGLQGNCVCENDVTI